MFATLVMIASLVITAHADPSGFEATSFIIGGKIADIETYPYQVSLEENGSHGCGGSIISSQHVLTAGHCVEGTSASRLRVRAGTSLRGQGGSLHRIARIDLHEGYGTNARGVVVQDVAVLRLAEGFEFGEGLRPAPLFEEAEEAQPGTQAVVTGWGRIANGSRPLRLQSVRVPIVSRRLCDRAFRASYGRLPQGQICAAYLGEGGRDACQGDSGGPLAIGGRIAGIVSWGEGCAEPAYPGVYTEVAYFRRWIDEHVRF